MSTSAAAKFVGGASEIAHHYGFRPLSEVAPDLAGAKLRSIPPDAAVAASAATSEISVEPVLTFYASAGAPDAVGPSREYGAFSLQIVGCPTSIGEVHMLKTLEAIASEHGAATVSAALNCLGDKDSRTRFGRELSYFLRRHATQYEAELSAPERTAIAENPTNAYRARSEVLQELLRDGPRPVHFLSEKSRVHFRQVLEHLERVNFPFDIDDALMGDGAAKAPGEARIIFKLRLDGEAGMIVGSLGGRYDDVSRSAGRAGLPAVHASIFFRAKAPAKELRLRIAAPRPQVYLIQFGDSAKLTGFSVLESLRRARIPVMAQFDARHLAPQLGAAQAIGVPYALIMGHREALDRTVIIRTLATSAQTTVPIAELSKYLRGLKLA